MNAVQRFFPKIINGASQFIIPVFQRDYSWTEENCRQLWHDLLAIADESADRGHFIGSVVYIQTGIVLQALLVGCLLMGSRG